MTRIEAQVGLPFGVKLLLITTAALVAVIVGLAAGILARFDGARTPACITRGGASFGVALTLLVLVLSNLGALG